MNARDRIVNALVPMMRHELQRNAYKGDDWAQLPPWDLSHEVLYHAAKLHLAILAADREAIAELCADVANCAAIAADALNAADVSLLPAPSPRGVTNDDYDQEGDGGMRYGSGRLKETVAGWMRELGHDGWRAAA